MLFLALIASIPLIHSTQDLVGCLPMSESAIEELVESSLSQFHQEFDNFLHLPTEERTFDNTIRAWDMLSESLACALSCLQTVQRIHPDLAIQDCLNRASQKLYHNILAAQVSHPEIFTIFLEARNTFSSMSELEQYYVDQLLLECRRMGMQLPDAQRAHLAKTRREIFELEHQFHRHILEDRSVLHVSKEELTGLDEAWIASREQNEDGTYQLTCDVPTYFAVLTNCSNRQTRKAFCQLFHNRAYPHNEEVVAQLIAKRDALGKLLGFSSYAAYDLSAQMAGSIEKVKEFLSQVKEKAAIQSSLEMALLMQDLPDSVCPTPSGQLESFDRFFVYNEYKKKHFALDATEVANYFPLEKTVQGLIDIYEQFFDLSIQTVPHSLPIPDLTALEIRNRSNELLGIILLDLFPRAGKYSHAGCCCPLIPAFSPQDGPYHPAAALVIANFTKPSNDCPALMRHSEVVTLFHEFGHAIHHVLGRNELLAFCGTNVKWDFVELPSQLLEQWMWEPSILQRLSSHYATGEPLSNKLMETLIRARDFGRGSDTQRQCYLAELSLALFSEGATKNPTELAHQLAVCEIPLFAPDPNNHFHNSWTHLAGYGPKYYSYLWSLAFAFDLFEKIRQGGLLNPAMGTAYAQTILSKGGSRDPNQMLIDFLGRTPSLEPFFSQLIRHSPPQEERSESGVLQLAPDYGIKTAGEFR